MFCCHVKGFDVVFFAKITVRFVTALTYALLTFICADARTTKKTKLRIKMR